MLVLLAMLADHNVTWNIFWMGCHECLIDVHCPHRMNCYHFGDPLTFHVAPSSGQLYFVCSAHLMGAQTVWVSSFGLCMCTSTECKWAVWMGGCGDYTLSQSSLVPSLWNSCANHREAWQLYLNKWRDTVWMVQNDTHRTTNLQTEADGVFVFLFI